MTRVFNFSPGPATLPEPVLRQAAQEMLDWHGSGMSVMEMSHRGKEFMSIHAEAGSLLRELLAIPANYKLLFMQGGAIGENAIVPMNLIGRTGKADPRREGEQRQHDQSGQQPRPIAAGPRGGRHRLPVSLPDSTGPTFRTGRKIRIGRTRLPVDAAARRQPPATRRPRRPGRSPR